MDKRMTSTIIIEHSRSNKTKEIVKREKRIGETRPYFTLPQKEKQKNKGIDYKWSLGALD